MIGTFLACMGGSAVGYFLAARVVAWRLPVDVVRLGPTVHRLTQRLEALGRELVVMDEEVAQVRPRIRALEMAAARRTATDEAFDRLVKALNEESAAPARAADLETPEKTPDEEDPCP